MESMGWHAEKDIGTPTASATSAAYAKALGTATKAAKASIAKYHAQKGVSHLSIRTQRDKVIEATLPTRGFNDERQADETRDQPIDLCDREETSQGDIVHTIPVNKMRDDDEQRDQELFSRNLEAKNLLQSIVNLDTEVTEAAAAVYHYFETKAVDDEVSPGARAVEVIHSIKEALRKGNSKPAYQFLETAKSVLPILLEEREEAGIQLEENIFSKDSEDSVPVPIDLCDHQDQDQDDMRSISEQTAAIFQFLDDSNIIATGERTSQSKDPDGTNFSSNMENNGNIFRILEEREEEALEYTADGIYSGDAGDFEDPSRFNAPNVDEMDLEFVENFDLAYSEFLFYHPKLVAKNPELLKNLRIYKLQKYLEYNEVLERANVNKLHSMFEEKTVIEESMQVKLKDAVRKKAARQTLLQAEVNQINWNTKQIQSKLRWKLFRYSEDRAKRQSKLREQFTQIPQARSRQDLIRLIPDGPHSKKLENAIKASFIAEGSPQPPPILSPKKADQLRKIQVENSVINSEMLIVNQKFDRLRREARKLEWVQTTLKELDPAALYKFKKRFAKNEGIKE